MELKPKTNKKLWYKQLQKCSLCGATLVHNSARCENCGNINNVKFEKDPSENFDGRKSQKATPDYASIKDAGTLLLFPCLYVLFSFACLWRLDPLMGLKTITIISYLLVGLIQGFILFADAIRHGIGDREDKYGHHWVKPWVWVAASFIAFPLTTPVYLYARSNYKEIDYRVGAFILSLIIVFIVGYSFSFAFKDPQDEMGTIEKAKLEQEEQRLSNPALFYTQP